MEHDVFLVNFMYPFLLILTGGGVSGILIPWYTSKQKSREKEIEKERADYQFKIKLKQEILDLFHNVRQWSFIYPVNFKNRISLHYGTKSTVSKDDPTMTYLVFEIPKNIKKKPKAVFGKEYSELYNQRMTKFQEYANLFETKVQWYSHDKKEILADFESLGKQTITLMTFLKKVMDSETTDEFIKAGEEFLKCQSELQDKFTNLTKKLVTIKITDIAI